MVNQIAWRRLRTIVGDDGLYNRALSDRLNRTHCARSCTLLSRSEQELVRRIWTKIGQMVVLSARILYKVYDFKESWVSQTENLPEIYS